jgi:hypothetical protein
MHRYKICVHNPSRPDVALFAFPAGTKPGKYIVHYRWNGYYDAIDVQIIAGSKKVENPYGVPLPPGTPPPLAKFKKIDHCEVCLLAASLASYIDSIHSISILHTYIYIILNPHTLFPPTHSFNSQSFSGHARASSRRRAPASGNARVSPNFSATASTCFPTRTRPRSIPRSAT